jgi:hypothetical protein
MRQSLSWIGVASALRGGCRGKLSWRAARGTSHRTMMSDADYQLVGRVVAAIADRTDAQGAALAAALAARWTPGTATTRSRSSGCAAGTSGRPGRRARLDPPQARPARRG